jgi:hypothetical protein
MAHLPLACEGGHEGMEVSPSGGAQHQRRDGQQHPEDRPPQHHLGKDEGPLAMTLTQTLLLVVLQLYFEAWKLL